MSDCFIVFKVGENVDDPFESEVEDVKVICLFNLEHNVILKLIH